MSSYASKAVWRIALVLLVAVTVSGRARGQPAGQGALPLETTRVDVTLSEYGIAMPEALAPGRYDFHVVNAGHAEHGFVIAHRNHEMRLGRLLEPGEVGDLSVYLNPGTYAVYCPVGHDRERGTTRKLLVKNALRTPVQ
jgi:hypothetical protein